jgi:hypothetical protein
MKKEIKNRGCRQVAVTDGLKSCVTGISQFLLAVLM